MSTVTVTGSPLTVKRARIASLIWEMSRTARVGSRALDPWKRVAASPFAGAGVLPLGVVPEALDPDQRTRIHGNQK